MTTISSHLPIFQAEWPKKFDPKFESILQKAGRIFWNIISVIIFPIGLCRLVYAYIRDLALRVAVPGNVDIPSANSYWEVAKHVVRFIFHPDNYKIDHTARGKAAIKEEKGEAVSFLTPDGAKIDGAFFSGKNPKKVILYIGGNMEQWEVSNFFGLKSLGASVLVLNSRGVGNSKAPWPRYENGFALDVYTAAEWLVHNKGIDPEDMIFVGFSMGGANTTRGAALIQEKYPDKKIKAVNINSFNSLENLIDSIFSSIHPLSIAARWGAKILQFKMDVKKDWDSLKGEKYIFYNPNDRIIPRPAQLATAVKQRPVGTSLLISLVPAPNHIPFYEPSECKAFYEVMFSLLGTEKKTPFFNTPEYASLEMRQIEQVSA